MRAGERRPRATRGRRLALTEAARSRDVRTEEGPVEDGDDCLFHDDLLGSMSCCSVR